MPSIQPSDFLPNFLHTLFLSKVSITTALYCHPSTYRLFFCKSALMGHAIVGRSVIPPVNPHSVHRLADESSLAPDSAPSRRRRFVHINAIKVLPARGVDRAAYGPARAARSPARSAGSVPLRSRLAHCGPLAARHAPR